MKAARRSAMAIATATLGLVLGGCGSHHDSEPQLHGAGSSQNEQPPAPVAAGGNPAGANGSSGSAGTPTPNAAEHMEFNGGSTGGGASTSTRATPEAGIGMVPGADTSGGGMGIFPTAAPG